jgi:hypothetical protein
MSERTLCLVFRNTREALSMTPLQNNLYRLEETSVCGLLRFGDTIEAYPPSEDGSIRYRRMVKRSELKTHSYILSQKTAQSPEMSRIIERIDTQGGHCECIAGGVFFAHIPVEANIDIGDELIKLQKNQK